MSVERIKPLLSPLNQSHEDRKLKIEDDLKGIKPDSFMGDGLLANGHKNGDKEVTSKQKNKESIQENEEDPYDLDVQIKDLASATIPSDTAQSEWSRCSCRCQTQRGATCVGCDTQQNAWTCVRC